MSSLVPFKIERPWAMIVNEEKRTKTSVEESTAKRCHVKQYRQWTIPPKDAGNLLRNVLP